MRNKKTKIIMISSSGGHYEQLRMLRSLESKYDLVWITEKTQYKSKADYYLTQTGTTDRLYIVKMIWIFFQSLAIWIKERPNYVISTGAIIAIPMSLIGKVFRKKIIFIETFARIDDSSKTGELFHKIADLFIIQWKSLKKHYPNSKFGGSIY